MVEGLSGTSEGADVRVSFNEEAASATDSMLFVPGPILSCLNFLDKHGLRNEGLWRQSGEFHRQTVLQTVLEEDHDGYYLFQPHEDVHTVAQIAVFWIKEKLPGGRILQEAAVEAAIETAKSDGLQFYKATQKLFKEHLTGNQIVTLGVLVQHWRRVAANADVTLMTPENIATCVMMTLGDHKNVMMLVKLKPFITKLIRADTIFPEISEAVEQAGMMSPRSLEALNSPDNMPNFDEVDEDGDGQISQEEWVRQVELARGITQQAFSRADDDGDGGITREEWGKAFAPGETSMEIGKLHGPVEAYPERDIEGVATTKMSWRRGEAQPAWKAQTSSAPARGAPPPPPPDRFASAPARGAPPPPPPGGPAPKPRNSYKASAASPPPPPPTPERNDGEYSNALGVEDIGKVAQPEWLQQDEDERRNAAMSSASRPRVSSRQEGLLGYERLPRSRTRTRRTRTRRRSTAVPSGQR